MATMPMIMMETPPAMYFQPVAFFMAGSPTREDVPDQVAVLIFKFASVRDSENWDRLKAPLAG
jgi:hypothetical protein